MKQHRVREILAQVVISLRPGIPRNPEHILAGTSLGFDYIKQVKYINGSVILNGLNGWFKWV
jgi:hypothetical protein